MDQHDFISLKQGLAEVEGVLAGHQGAAVVHTPELINARHQRSSPRDDATTDNGKA